MNKEQIQQFFQRIDTLEFDKKPTFGSMNAGQMICHCTDQIRVALGTIEAEEYGKLSPKEVIALSKAGKTVPVAKGLGQVEGDGTQPVSFEMDKALLKEHILEFEKLDADFNFGLHPYFGKMSKEKWTRLTVYHLNHHLTQFKV